MTYNCNGLELIGDGWPPNLNVLQLNILHFNTRGRIMSQIVEKLM